MDLFELVESLEGKPLNQKFLLLKNEFTLKGEREIIARWADGFHDRDNKMRKEFQTTFHSTFWELYLFQVLKRLDLTIDWEKNRPDFVITGPTELCIEAVVSEIKKDGRPEVDRNFDDIYSMTEPAWLDPDYETLMHEAITRYSNSILGKRKKFQKEYSSLDWVRPIAPYVIALSSYAQVRYGKEYHYPMVALLYGQYFDPHSKSYTKREYIIKPGTSSSIPLDIFSLDEMKCVSAVVFSCTVTMGKLASLVISDETLTHPTNFVFLIREDFDEPHFKIQIVSPESPEDLFDGLFIFHNPNATNPLPRSLFEGTSAIQVWREGSALAFEGENLPLVARLNLTKIFLPGDMKNLVMFDAFNKFNSP